MKRILPPISPALRSALLFSLALQSGILLLASCAADCGQSAQICCFAVLGFGGFLISVLLRRRTSPTCADPFLIRAGYLPAILIAAVLADHIWTLRGF